MAVVELGRPVIPPTPMRPARERVSSWPLIDRIAFGLCWAVGIGLCLVTAGIILYTLTKGVSYVRLGMLFESPKPSLTQKSSGGFSDPILGTLLIVAIGTVVVTPVGVGLAVWLSEHRNPRWLARAVESAVEMVAGAPSVVLAFFGLLIFDQSFLGFLSQRAVSGAVTGISFLTAGIVMSALAMPLVVASTREALAQIPDRTREASYALGKTRLQTIGRVLLPSARPGISTGVVLGMGRIIGDTAIITILLGGTANKLTPANGTPVLGLLRGTGSTLTSYIYYMSPAGEGNSPNKAFAAAFVLLAMVLALNALASRLARGEATGERRRLLKSIDLRGALAWTR